MDSLLLSFNVVAPLMVYMAIGWLLRRTNVMNGDACTTLSQIVFRLLVPALCINNIRTIDFAQIFGDPFVLYLVALVLVVFAVTMFLVPRFCRENPRRGVIVQGIYRSNDAVFGLAVGAALLSEAEMPLMVLCVAASVPVFNILAVISMEYFRGGRANIADLLKKFITNPIILGCLGGILLSLFKIDLPVFIAKPLSALSGACAPLGFVAMGGALSFASLRKNRAALTAVSILRLIVAPLFVLALLYLLGYRNEHLLVPLIIFGAPTAMSVYPMASGMDGDATLAAGIVAVTSVLSIVTIFLFIFILKELGVA